MTQMDETVSPQLVSMVASTEISVTCSVLKCGSTEQYAQWLSVS